MLWPQSSPAVCKVITHDQCAARYQLAEACLGPPLHTQQACFELKALSSIQHNARCCHALTTLEHHPMALLYSSLRRCKYSDGNIELPAERERLTAFAKNHAPAEAASGSEQSSDCRRRRCSGLCRLPQSAVPSRIIHACKDIGLLYLLLAGLFTSRRLFLVR